MRLVAMLVGVVAMVALATGCGGGSSELTKAELIEQGDAICKQTSEQIAREYQAFVKQHKAKESGVTKSEGTEIGVKILLPATQEEAEELRDLSPPAADEKQIKAMLDALEKGVEEGKKEPSSLFGGEFPLAPAYAMAHRYGFKVCGLS